MNLTNYRVRFPCKTFKHLINPTYKSKCFCTLCLGVNTLNGSLTFQQQQQQLFQNSCVLLSPSYQFLPLSEAPFFTCLTQFFARRYLLVYSISLSICLSLSPIPFSNVVSFSLLNHFLGCFIVLFPDPILSFQDGSFYLSFSYFAAINSFLSIYGELLNYGPSSSLDFSRQCPVWDSNP